VTRTIAFLVTANAFEIIGLVNKTWQKDQSRPIPDCIVSSALRQVLRDLNKMLV